MFGKDKKSSKTKNDTRSAMLNIDTDLDVKFESAAENNEENSVTDTENSAQSIEPMAEVTESAAEVSSEAIVSTETEDAQSSINEVPAVEITTPMPTAISESKEPDFIEPDIPVDNKVAPIKTKEVFTVVSNYNDDDPDVFDGDSIKLSSRKSKSNTDFTYKPNKVEPVKVDIKGNPDNAHSTNPKNRRKALGYIITSVIIVILVVCGTVFYEAGIKEKLKSPLTINGVNIDSSEFSFMYHYILIENGVDIFASDTEEMLNSKSDDPSFDTTRDYFLDLTAKEMQTMQILYDDAIKHGEYIGDEHYSLARAYVDWLQTKASDIKVPLDTYISGVFGSQVDEQCVLNTLAKKYFTEDYSSGAKLVELSASEAQADEAYKANPNAYDLVDYKIARFVYEQRDEQFIKTANIRADEMIAAMGNDPDLFELAAAQSLGSNDDSEDLLVSNVRYTDFTSHTDFRDWLFDVERQSGDTVIFHDNDGFPIVLCFVKRQRQSIPLRDVRIVQVNYVSTEEFEGADPSVLENFYSVAQAQETAQSIYEYIASTNNVAEVENIYTDEVLRGIVTVTSDNNTYVGKYNDVLNDWIFDDNRKPNDKKIIEGDGCFYVVFFVSESEKPEWYDRVNSFIRMNNYQAFINEMVTEYDYSFNTSGLEEIRDVP
ncbi:MAG: hypothetical protein MJ153_01175 [Clostridia bacterium]|nr:hypothetical protein [Clostridia bacterium]